MDVASINTVSGVSKFWFYWEIEMSKRGRKDTI